MNDLLFDPLGGWIYYTLHSMKSEEGGSSMAKVYQFLDEKGLQVLTNELFDRLNERLNLKLNIKLEEFIVREISENSDHQHSLSALSLYNIFKELRAWITQLDTDDKTEMRNLLNMKANKTDLDELKDWIIAQLLLKANLDDMLQRLDLKADKTQLAELERLIKEDFKTKLDELKSTVEDLESRLYEEIAMKVSQQQLEEALANKADKSALDTLNNKIERDILPELGAKASKTQLNELEVKIQNDITPKLLLKADKSYVDTELEKKVNKADIESQLNLKADKTELDARIKAVIDSAPEALDTLKELAEALGNDENFHANLVEQLTAKVDRSDFEEMSAKVEGKLDASFIEGKNFVTFMDPAAEVIEPAQLVLDNEELFLRIGTN